MSSSTTRAADAINVHVATNSKAADGELTVATVPVSGPGASLAEAEVGFGAAAETVPECWRNRGAAHHH